MNIHTLCGRFSAAPPLPTISGSQSIVNLLLAEGIDMVFGYLGAAVLPVFDKLGSQANGPSNKHNYCNHNNIQETKMSKDNPKTNEIARKPGSQIIADILAEQGTEVMFGYLGGVVLPLFDKLYDSPIKFIIPRHEQGGCHMADAYARATGKVGVVIATSGPGATNLVTGLANAMMDSIPIVALTGQVRTELIGYDSFQEADTTGITRPVTKHNMIIKNPAELPQALREAFYIAKTGRPGPVLIDIPVDMQVAQIPVSQPTPIELPGFRHRLRGHARQISIAAQAINDAQKPVLYIGGGVITSNASEELKILAKKANIPVTMTLMGLGAYDQNDPGSLDMLGMHGTAYANFAVQNCDVLIAVGARFDDRVTGRLKTFAPHAKIIHVDLDPASISKNVPAHIPVVGDAKEVLAAITLEAEHRPREDWWKQINEWKAKFPLRYDTSAKTIKPQFVIEEIWRQTKGQATVVTGVGQHQMWAAQFYKFSRPRQFITSGGLGTMGFGLPAAIGAQIAKPGELVVDIDGDSSFCMTLTELSTAVQYNLPIKVVILNNGYMGMVRQWQELFYGKRYSYSYLQNPDFAKLADAFGAVGYTVNKKEDLAPTFEKMLKETKPCVVDVHVDREENVWPMVPSGKSLHEMDGLDVFELA